MHYSTDRLISTILKEKHNFDSIAACVEAKGWPLFRDIEKEVVFQTLQTAS
jgi:shikimate kinase